MSEENYRQRLARGSMLVRRGYFHESSNASNRMRNLTATEAQDLCEIIEERSINKSIAFTTQFPLAHWNEVIPDTVIFDAIRDRLERLHLPKDLPEPLPSTCALADWYVHLVRFGRSEFAVGTSERSLLTVLLAARGLRTGLAPNLRAAVGAAARQRLRGRSCG
jgi:hypothetical protein